ncbi:MAG: class I SAM-dependent methyltransferase [Bacteroidales bacterium]|nr:class I SAM-dependent methyltransferase [Bacteroidales bacterium]
MRKLVHLINYLDYLRKSKSAHGIHSPFVYQFITEVLHDKTYFAGYELVKNARNRFRRSKQLIEITDFGAFAGKHRFKTRFRRVGQIAGGSGVPARMGELLFRIVRHYKPENIIELGTSLGISTMYLSLANPDARITTIEGCATTAEIAQKNFKDHQLENIELRCGEFRHMLDHVVKEMPRLDFAFIDGNHRKEPTLHYFNACLEKSHNGTILVFDDIYWSKGMKQAWTKIKAHPQVSVSIDLFRFGIVFFREELSKENFVIR